MMMEMAEGNPPYIEHPPLRAVFLLNTRGVPSIKNKSNFSDLFIEFLDLCLTVDPSSRPKSYELIDHPFLSFLSPNLDIYDLVLKVRELKNREIDLDIDLDS